MQPRALRTRRTTRIGRAERSTRRFLLIAALILAVISLTAFLAPLMLSVPPRVTGAVSWRPTALGSAVLVGLLLRELRGAWLVLTVGVGLIELPLLFMRQPSLAMLATFTQTVLVGLVLGFVGTVMLRLSRSADTAGAGRERAAAAAAAAAGAGSARARAAALVHDEVLSTLNLATAPHLVDVQELAEQAIRAKGLLADASDDEQPASAVAALREEVTGLDPEAGFAVLGVGQGLPIEVAADVLSILRSAVRQALQNSLLHAGSRARRQVAVEHGPERLRVTVTDDGIGFDLARVSTRRLGLRTTAGAVRAVGGEVTVSSGVGSGTRVAIEWAASAAESPESAEHAACAAHPQLGDTPLVRTGVMIATATFVASQTALAAVATSTAQPWWVPLPVLGLLFASALLLQHRYATRLGDGGTALVLCLIMSAMIIGVLGAPFEVGDLWFAGAAAFLLTALAFRGRVGAAAAGGLLLSAVLMTSGIVNSAPPFLIVSVSVRPFGVTCFAVALAVGAAALLQRTARDLAATEAASARESWERSARVELAAQAVEVRALVDEMLGEIALGRPLAEDSRAHAQALEGRLRDRIRAGRLAVEPLMSAVMRARERGVDVLLLDDLEGGLPEHFDLDRAAVRLAAACDGASEQVTVRVLPAGRSAVISLVADGSPVALL